MTDESSFERISVSSGELSDSWDLVVEHPRIRNDIQQTSNQNLNGLPICSICHSPIESVYFRCSTCDDLIICRNCECKPNQSVLCLGGASHLLALCNQPNSCCTSNLSTTDSMLQSDCVPILSPETRIEQWISRSSRSASISSSSSSSSSHYNSVVGDAVIADAHTHQNPETTALSDPIKIPGPDATKPNKAEAEDVNFENAPLTQKSSPSLIETLQSMPPLGTIPATTCLKANQSATQLFQQDRLPHRIAASTFLDDTSPASMSWFGFGSSLVNSKRTTSDPDQGQNNTNTSSQSPLNATTNSSTSSASSLLASADRASPVGFRLSRDSSPQSSSGHSLSSSPLGVATQFLKSVVKYSAAAFNNFDLLPMDDPAEFRIGRRSENRSNSISSTDSDSSRSGNSPDPNSRTTTDSRLLNRPLDTISSTFGLRQSPPPMRCFPSFPLTCLDSKTNPSSLIKVWDQDRFRDLVNPKPLPRTIAECTAYNLR